MKRDLAGNLQQNIISDYVKLVLLFCDFFNNFFLKLRIHYLYNQIKKKKKARLNLDTPSGTVPVKHLLIHAELAAQHPKHLLIHSFRSFQKRLTDCSCVPSLVLGPGNVAMNNNK